MPTLTGIDLPPPGSWDEFEDIVWELHRRAWNDPHAQRIGRSGQAQHGVDVAGQPAGGGGGWHGVQCKRYSDGALTKSVVRAAVEEAAAFRPALAQFAIVTSARRDAKVQEAVRLLNEERQVKGGCPVDIVFWEGVRSDLYDAANYDLLIKYYPFLAAGVPNGPQPFVSPKHFFGMALDARSWLNHTLDLVGRGEELAHLAQFLGDDDARVQVVFGSGGIGKSRLLVALAACAAKRFPAFDVRCAADGIAIAGASDAYLPAGPVLLIVDDAHRRDDLAAVLALAARYRDRLKLVVASRPHFARPLDALISHSKIDRQAVAPQIALKALTAEDVEHLAGLVIGQANPIRTQRLARVSRDSPLVTVIGGHLLAERALPPELLEQDPEFRSEVFSRFYMERVGAIDPLVADQGTCRALLELIAALAPVSTGDDAYLTAASTFLDIRSHDLIAAQTALELAGVLARVGDAVRITPDVLSDHILSLACLNKHGKPTGYAAQVLDHFRGTHLRSLLRNLAELDWRVRRATGAVPDLLAPLWRQLHEGFLGASHADRCHLLDMLSDVAFFQPEPVLALVLAAIRHPAPDEDDDAEAVFYRYTHRTVLRKLPKLLQQIAYTPDYLPRCLDLLWDLGRDDDRPLNPTPEHALRVLRDEASYDIGKPFSANAAVVDAVERWLAAPGAHGHLHSPLDALEPLLAKTDHSGYSKGFQFVTHAFLVPEPGTRVLRTRVLHILAAQSQVGEVQVERRAIDLLGRMLADPLPLFNMVMGEDDRAVWRPEQHAILDHLAILAPAPTHPLVGLQLVESLSWTARMAPGNPLRERAREIIATVPRTYDLLLTRSLLQKYRHWVTMEDEEDEQAPARMHERATSDLQHVARELRRRYPRAADGGAALDSAIMELRHLAQEPHAEQLLGALSTLFPAYGLAMVAFAIRHPAGEIARAVHMLLIPHTMRCRPEVDRLLDRALNTHQLPLVAAVALTYLQSDMGWAITVPDADVARLDRLLDYPDLQVRHLTLQAVQRLGRHAPGAAFDLAMRTELAEGLAETFCSIFDNQWGIPLATLSDQQVTDILAKLQNAPDLDEYSAGELLARVARRLLDAFIDFLLCRTANPTWGRNVQGPIPMRWTASGATQLPDASASERILRRIRDARLSAEDLGQRQRIAHLFHTVPVSDRGLRVRVLTEVVGARNSRTIEAVGDLVRPAGLSFVFDNQAFVATLLAQAGSVGQACLEVVFAGLRASAVAMERSRTGGQYAEVDVILQRNAVAAAAKHPAGSEARRLYDSLARLAEENMEQDRLNDAALLAR